MKEIKGGYLIPVSMLVPRDVQERIDKELSKLKKSKLKWKAGFTPDSVKRIKIDIE